MDRQLPGDGGKEFRTEIPALHCFPHPLYLFARSLALPMRGRKKRHGREFGYIVFYKITRYNRRPAAGTVSLIEKSALKGRE